MVYRPVRGDIRELRTLRDMLTNSDGRYGERPALALRGGASYSYREVSVRAARLRALLASQGITRGARVALLGENTPAWGIAYLAITTMGAVVVPILPGFSPESIASILRHSGSEGLIVSESMRGTVPSDRAIGLVIDLDQINRADIGSSDYRVVDDRGSGSPGGADPWDDGPPVEETDLAAILYTSGTTGDPKGVMLTHRNIVQNIIGSMSLIDIRPEDRFLSILPLAHSYECTIGFLIPIASGASITYLNGPPALSVLLPALSEVKPTVMVSVPLIMEKLYDARVRPVFARNAVTRAIGRVRPLRALVHRAAARKAYQAFGGALRFYGIGGAPIAPEAELFLREGRFPYAVGYGLTETAPLIAGTDAEHTRYRSTGPPIPGVEVRIAADDGGEGQGGEGELEVRGLNVMQGYYRNEQATRDAFTDDGWLRTGDLASRDPDGYLYIRGRLKNMILGPSGENIYPEDIEHVINRQELVDASVVFEWEGNLMARVRLDIEKIRARNAELAETAAALWNRAEEIAAEVRTTVNEGLGRTSRLSRIILQREEFERTPTRKIKRYLYTHPDEDDRQAR